MSVIINYLNAFPLAQLLLFIPFFILFFVQIIYWLNYSRVATHRHPHRNKEDESDNKAPGVSVIVIVEYGDESFLEHGLPLFMEQSYPCFEVVLVNNCGGEQISYAIEQQMARYPNLRFTTLRKDDNFRNTRKIPLLIGIKAAKYENLVFSHTNALPASKHWLQYMTYGFLGGELIITHSGFEYRHGFLNKLIRSQRFITSLRYLSKAISGNSYRGIYSNIGYTKSLFFRSRGYTHLNMHIGEDDLFVCRAAKLGPCSVIINPHCKTIQTPATTFNVWWEDLRRSTYGFRYYPNGVRVSIFLEIFSRVAILALLISIIVVLPLSPYSYAATTLWILRELVVWRTNRRVAKRLGEKNIVFFLMFYDLWSPFFEAILALSRRLKPSANLYLRKAN